MVRRTATLVIGLSCLILAAGCGRASGPVPVTGVVTADGKGLADARVTFNPVDSSGRMAFGMTDPEGRFRLTTFKHNDGALAGRYKITVNVTGPNKEADAKLATNLKEMMAERDRLMKTKPVQVHANYVNLAKTPLVQDVPIEGELKLELRKDGT